MLCNICKRKYQEELQRLQNSARYFMERCEDLEIANNKLIQELEDTERQKLLREIEDLKDKLLKARNREHVLIHQRNDAERETMIAKSQVWDDFKPTKEQVKQYYNKVLMLLDCEDND